MAWPEGLRRVRLTGTLCLLAGAALLTSQVLTGVLHYVPDAGFVSLYMLMWPAGLFLLAAGGLFRVSAWILAGFKPDSAPQGYLSPDHGPEDRRDHDTQAYRLRPQHLSGVQNFSPSSVHWVVPWKPPSSLLLCSPASPPSWQPSPGPRCLPRS